MRAVVAWLVLAGPVVCGTALVAYDSVVERSGAMPPSGAAARNSAEAAALGDAATMLRFMRLGDDPNRVHPIRPWIISSSVQQATTLEAALWSRREEMIRMLDRQGAIVGRDTRRELACLARDLDLPDVGAYLVPGGVTCAAGEAMAAIVARTRGPGDAGHD